MLDRISPIDALEILREGNRRFRTGQSLTRDINRHAVEAAQNRPPLAAVLSCSDLRVPPELVFDMGLGDVVSVRVAGNVAGGNSLGSLEYAVSVAGVKLLVVLGHTRCGAVDASVQALVRDQNEQQEAVAQVSGRSSTRFW